MTPSSGFPSTSNANTVRPARQADCSRIAELADQLGYQCTPEEIAGRLRDMQDSNQYAVFVVELSGGQIVGWIGAYLFRSVETGSWAEINGFIVDHQMRSLGIGRVLLDAVEKWARSIGSHTIAVRSNINRDRAHRFYEDNNYAYTKTQKEFHKKL
jgi:GNAT superfamily N-acetyltransferase